jgi:hypothetical protein
MPSLYQHQDTDSLLQFIKDNPELKSLTKYVPQILERFDSFEGFGFWYEGLTASPTFLGISHLPGKARYLIGSLLSEIGIKNGMENGL